MNLPEATHPQQSLAVSARRCQYISIIRVWGKLNFYKSDSLLETLNAISKMQRLIFCLATAYNNSVLSPSLASDLRIIELLIYKQKYLSGNNFYFKKHFHKVRRKLWCYE